MRHLAALLLLSVLSLPSPRAFATDEAELRRQARELGKKREADGTPRVFFGTPSGTFLQPGSAWTNFGSEHTEPQLGDLLVPYQPPPPKRGPRGPLLTPESAESTLEQCLADPSALDRGERLERGALTPGADRANGVIVARILWNLLRPSKLGDGTHDGHGNPTNPKER